jgi:hypothetical protein
VSTCASALLSAAAAGAGASDSAGAGDVASGLVAHRDLSILKNQCYLQRVEWAASSIGGSEERAIAVGMRSEYRGR